MTDLELLTKLDRHKVPTKAIVHISPSFNPVNNNNPVDNNLTQFHWQHKINVILHADSR